MNRNFEFVQRDLPPGEDGQERHVAGIRINQPDSPYHGVVFNYNIVRVLDKIGTTEFRDTPILSNRGLPKQEFDTQEFFDLIGGILNTILVEAKKIDAPNSNQNNQSTEHPDSNTQEPMSQV